MQFNEFINELAIDAPFGIDFKIKPSRRVRGEKKEIIEGITVNLFKDVSVSEKWFFESVEKPNKTQGLKLQVEMKLLAVSWCEYLVKEIAKLDEMDTSEFTDEELAEHEAKKAYLEVETLADAVNILFEPKRAVEKATSEEQKKNYSALISSDYYSNFIKQSQSAIDKIQDITKAIQSQDAIKWVFVTYFLMSRFDADWSFEDTGDLTPEELDEVYKCIEHERTKGVGK